MVHKKREHKSGVLYVGRKKDIERGIEAKEFGRVTQKGNDRNMRTESGSDIKLIRN